MPYWRRQFSTGYVNRVDGLPDVSASQSSQIVSILSAGTFFGALTAAPVGDFMGRRWGLVFSAAIVFNLGVILQTAATAIPMFTAGRFFAGYGVGLISALSKYPHTRFGITCLQFFPDFSICMASFKLDTDSEKLLVICIFQLPEVYRHLFRIGSHTLT